jgi:hypothetical protein
MMVEMGLWWFYSKYFSFPQSLSFHQCCMLIHPSPSLYKISRWQHHKMWHTSAYRQQSVHMLHGLCFYTHLQVLGCALTMLVCDCVLMCWFTLCFRH